MTKTIKSGSYKDFKKGLREVNYLTMGAILINKHKNCFIKRAQKSHPKKSKYALEEFINKSFQEGIVFSNIKLRSLVERYGKSKSSTFKNFLSNYKSIINDHKIKYDRNQKPLTSLDINRDLRNYSIHPDKKYKFIKSNKKPREILLQQVWLFQNPSGDEIVLLLHDLLKSDRLKMAKNVPLDYSNSCLITYEEYLENEIKKLIEEIEFNP